MKDITEETLSTFKGLTDPKRLEILSLLRKGERCACHILDRLDLTQSQLSYHCKILIQSKLIKCRHEGKWCYYSLNIAGKERAKELLDMLIIETEQTESCERCKN